MGLKTVTLPKTSFPQRDILKKRMEIIANFSVPTVVGNETTSFWERNELFWGWKGNLDIFGGRNQGLEISVK